MIHSLSRRGVLGACLLMGVLGIAVLPLAAQDAKKEKAKGRLPPYYNDVVDDAEKEKIYAIQATYADKIDKLEAELESLKAERDKKIEGVLPAAKLKKIAEAKAEAAKKAADKKAKNTDKKE